jgi:hypothetical protein
MGYKYTYTSMLFWIGVYTLTHTAHRDQHCTAVAYRHTIKLCTKQTGSKQCIFSSMHFIGSKQFASHKSKIMLLQFLEGEPKFVYIKIDIVYVHVQSFFRSLCSNWRRPPKGAHSSVRAVPTDSKTGGVWRQWSLCREQLWASLQILRDDSAVNPTLCNTLDLRG